ncbi:helix-turn-helix domain-containing protein [Staphylococcus caeli]|uniref:helix-turn-helix domain-containing protein n=1 Tax=Staphylococcus caeli TaxID=2201815 RepID=UPI003F55DE5A
MKAQCLNIISKDKYPTKRVTDGLVLLFPLKGKTKVQHFLTDEEVENDLLIINNAEIFSINHNEIALLLYISSDWFYERGYSFFEYQYTSKLIQSSSILFEALLNIAKYHLNRTLTKENFDEYMYKIVDIIATEAKIDINYLKQQTDYSQYGITGEMLDYVDNHLHKRMTLKAISSKVFISQSNISSQFYNLLGMSFKTYVDTLKLSTSVASLLCGQCTISEISERYGFSSSASYSKKFKHYFGYAPKAYRRLSKNEKLFEYSTKSYDALFIDGVQKILSKKLDQLNVQNNYICLNMKEMTKATNDTVVIQIHTIEDLHFLFNNKSMSYVFEGKQKVLIYCMIRAEDLRNAFVDDLDCGFIDFVLNTNVNLAFQISDSTELNIYIDEIYKRYKTFLEKHPELSERKMHSVSYIFNLATMSIKEIYRNIIKIQRYRKHVSFGVDVTHLFNHPESFKMMESQLKRIGFDYYFIDNHKLNSPYLDADHEDLLTKEVFKFSNIKKIMAMMKLEERKYFLLNVHNNILLNDKTMEIIESPPLLMDMFKKVYRNFSGIGIDLIEQQGRKNALYLYDRKGFRSLLGNIYERLMEKGKYLLKEYDFYTVVEQSEKITIFVGDWRVIESESAVDKEAQNIQLHINFKDYTLRRPYMIFYETINSTYGNINGAIPTTLRNRYDWPEAFIKKIDDYNKPKFSVFEHDFEDETLTLNLDYNTLHIIDIYK